MINIFISRPTWIAEEFREGLSGFLSFLDTHDIKPRTIGSTDYPTESPLDEVIALMNECKGVIVLGYPQIYVTTGKIKGADNTDFLLPTEWNHIEATLAYMKKMPLLVIHHKGISRGIFDRGAISKFIYDKDLAKTNWFLSEDIRGALKRWQASLEKPPTYTTRDIKPGPKPPSHVQIVAKPVTISPSSEGRLEKDVESVLVYLFNQYADTNRNSDAIQIEFHCNLQAAQYYIEALLGRKMISTAGQFWLGGNYYSLTSNGREYVMTNKLASI